MATKSLNTQSTPADNKFVDDKLRPTAEIQILVGGPYTHDKEVQRYGHTSLRVVSRGADTTYDFGRYGRVTGDFGAEGEGILRVWSDFRSFISSENALGRNTTAFVYAVFDYQAKAVLDHFGTITSAAKQRPDLERGRSTLKVFQLNTNYHALGYNCTTLSLEGAERGIPGLTAGSISFIRPDAVLTLPERIAMKTVGGGTPSRIFLPANLEDFLHSKVATKTIEPPGTKPIRVEVHGG